MDGPRNRKPFPATVFSFPLFPLLLVYRDIERKGADSTTLPSSSSTSHSSTRLSALPSTPHPLLSSFRCTISPSLFHSFLPSFSLSPSKAIVTGNRCTPSLSFYLYARCGQIIIGELLYSRGTLVAPPLHFFAGVIPPLEKMPGRNLFHLYFHLRYELTTWIRAVASWRLVFVRRSGFCPEFLPSRDLPLQFSFFSFSPRIVVRLVPAKNTPDF